MADMTTLIVISSFIMFPAVMMAQEVVNHGVCPVPRNKEEEKIIKEQERNREEMEEIMREIEISCLDECKTGLHNCHDDAYCTNTKGSFTCTCKQGYSGDGVNCTDINECETGEHLCNTDISECKNNKGSYKCVLGRIESSCKKIYDKTSKRENKAYFLNVESKLIPVYCHMEAAEFGACGGGGWTLVMKTDGEKNTFRYDSQLWTNKKDHNPSAGKTLLNGQETKLPTYWSTPFTKICLAMKIGLQVNSIVINKQANSLHSLIADGDYRSTSLGRDTWKKLIGRQASLQRNCNKEGFNCHGLIRNKARIGIIGNEQNECNSPDSRIGFGFGGYPYGDNTCGNTASHEPDNGNRNIKAWGYILVQ
ncbi:uncharacterized protein [Porites lutea]|uniref:uncharacterized protein n=1 Tax=Porites lutea TaxID=51062 RepID=UPI003CC56010